MRFSKIHGCGNDFIFIDYEEGIDYSPIAKKLCNRYISIGGDGLIVVKTFPQLEMIYYNADGSRAPMCGNGIRCFALYCYRKGIRLEKEYDVLTLSGLLKVEVESFSPFRVKINMAKASFLPHYLRLNKTHPLIDQEIVVKNMKVRMTAVYLGTVHSVIFVDDFSSPLLSIAKDIHKNNLFLEKTNVNFVQIINEKLIRVKTYERGVGWTRACGTGCCASVYVGEYLGKLNKKCKVLLEYGDLDIEIKDSVFMAGPAEFVYESEVK